MHGDINLRALYNYSSNLSKAALIPPSKAALPIRPKSIPYNGLVPSMRPSKTGKGSVPVIS